MFNQSRLLYFLYAFVAFVAIWYWHVDEHYQIFEFASYKLGFTPLENLAWEYKSHIRSGILPFFAYCVSKILLFLQVFNPFLVEAICRVLGSLLFVFVMQRLILKFEIDTLDNDSRKRFFLFHMLFWILPIVMVRFSSEAIGASLFWIGFLFLDVWKDKVKFRTIFFVGIIWGLAFYIRIHLAILIGMTYLWMLCFRRQRWPDIFLLAGGFGLATIVEISLNYWLYGAIVWTPFDYFKVNIIDNVASQYGVMPFYFYIVEIVKNLLPPLSLFILGGLGLFVYYYPKSIYSWLLASFILIHSLIGHKEYRFLFPIFPILAPLACLGFVRYRSTFLNSKYAKWLWRFNLLLLPAALFIHSFTPYNHFSLYPKTLQYHQVYTDSTNPYCLNEKTENVRPYFWKSSHADVLVLDSNTSIDSVSIFISKTDYGDTFRYKSKPLYKSFGTIDPRLKEIIPKEISKTIDHMYIYESKQND
jgi:phosphatidylinositol glycan class B